MSDLTYTVKAEGVKDVEALTRSLESLHNVLNSGKGAGKSLEEVRRLIVGFKGQASVFEEMRNSMQSMQQSMADMSNKMPAVVRMMTRGIAQEMKVVVATMRTDGAAAGKALTESMAESLGAGANTVAAKAKTLAKAVEDALDPKEYSFIQGIRNATKTATAEASKLGASFSEIAKSSEAGKTRSLASLKELEQGIVNFGAVRDRVLSKLGSQATPDTGLRIYTQKVNEDIASLNAAYKKLEETANLKDRIRARLGSAGPSDTGRLLQGSSQQTSLAASRAFDYGSKDYAKSMDELRKSYAEVEVKQKDVAKSSDTLGSAFKKLTIDGNDMHSMARGLASGFNLLWLTWGNLVPLFAGAAISNGFMQTAKTGMEVAHTFKTIEVLGGNTAQEMAALNAELINLGKNGPFGPKEIAESMKTLSLAGLKANEILAVTKDVLNFSVAGTTDLKTAADALVSISTAFGMGAQGFGRVADVVSKAAAESKSSVESFANAMKTASVIHKQYGVSLEDTATGIAALSQLGIEGTAAGTALRNMYADLSGRSMQVAKVLKAQGIEMRTATGEFRPMLEVVAELNNKLLKLDGISQKNLLQAILSERGAKGMIELLQLIQQEAKDMGSGLSSALAELQRNITESYGFAAISAAQLAQTTQESFKAVKATLSTSMNEAYQAMEPTLYLLADTLKKTFSSPEFVSGLTTMVSFVANLARSFVELTKFVVEHAEAIALVSAAYVGVTMLIRNKAAAMAAATAATTADTAATVANNAAKAGATGALGIMARILPGIGTAVSIAAVAWSAYDLWQNRAKDTTVEAANLYNNNVIKNLEDEAKRLAELNKLRATGLTLSEAQARMSAQATTRMGLESAEANYRQAADKATAAESLYQSKKATGRTQFQDSGGLGWKSLEDYRTAAEEARLSALAAHRIMNQTKVRLESAAAKVATETKVEADRQLAEAKERTKRLTSSFGTGAFSLAGAKGTDGAKGVMPSARQEVYTEQKALAEITKARDEELANSKRSYDLSKQLLDNRFKNELLTRTEYAIQAAAQTEDFEEKQINSLIEYNQKYQEQSLKAIAELKRNEALYLAAGNKDRAENFASLAATQSDSAIRIEKDTAEKITNIRQEAATRNQIIMQDMVGEASKLLLADSKIWKDRRDKRNAAKDLEAINLQYKYLNTSVFSAAEGEKAYVMAMAETMSSVRAQNEALEQLADHLQAVADAQYAIIMTKDYTGQEDGVSEADLARLQKLLTAKEAVAKLRQRIADNTEQGFIQGAEEGALATAKVMQEKRDALVNGVSSAIETAVFEGGSAGGKAMRQYLQDELLRKPFRAFVQTTVSYLLNGVLGSVGGAAVSSIAGGATNSVLGSVGTSFATSAGLSASGMAGLGTALGDGFMSTVSGMFSGGAPVTSMGMGASGTAFNVGAALPYVGGALVVANVLGLFRKTTTTDVGIKGTLGYQSDLSAFTTKRKSGTLISGPKYWDELASIPDKQSEAIDNSVKSIYSAVEASAKALGINADAIRNFTQSIFISTKDLTEEQVQAKLSAEFTKLGDSLSALVLPTTEYAKAGETASTTLQRLATSLTAVNNTFNLLGLKLLDVSAMGADAASKLVDSFGGLEAFNSKFSAYYDAFYTEEEKRANVVKEITKTLQAAGSALTEDDIASKTVQEFRAIYESLVKTNGAADPLAVAMINVAGAFAGVASSSKAAADRLREDKLREEKAIASDRKAFVKARREMQEAQQKSELDAIEASKTAAADLFKSIQDHIKGINDWLKGTLLDDKSLLSPEGKVQEAQAQFDALYGRAVKGDAEAMGMLTQAASALRDVARDAYASSGAYGAIESDIRTRLASLQAGMFDPNRPTVQTSDWYGGGGVQAGVALSLAETMALTGLGMESASLLTSLNRYDKSFLDGLKGLSQAEATQALLQANRAIALGDGGASFYKETAAGPDSQKYLRLALANGSFASAGGGADAGNMYRMGLQFGLTDAEVRSGLELMGKGAQADTEFWQSNWTDQSAAISSWVNTSGQGPDTLAHLYELNQKMFESYKEAVEAIRGSGAAQAEGQTKQIELLESVDNRLATQASNNRMGAIV